MEASASLCTPSGVQSKLAFNISHYSLQRGLGVSKYFSSAAFDVSGYFWHIKYYPDEDYVPLSLELARTNVQAGASFEVRLVDQANKLSPLVVLSHKLSIVFCSHSPTYVGKHFLQPSAHLQDDNLVIECDITVLAAITAPSFNIQVPPSYLSDNLGELLKAGEGTDVTFKVRGESFPAHKIVLAMRSPVFKADLFGPMSDRTRRTITIEDMQPANFSALLHFIYMDSLPSMGHLDGDDGEEMVKHLVVAVDSTAFT